jgi:hypothetical protein
MTQTKQNLRDVEDSAVRYGLSDTREARFARRASGISSSSPGGVRASLTDIAKRRRAAGGREPCLLHGIQEKVKPEHAERNVELVRAVYEELERTQP